MKTNLTAREAVLASLPADFAWQFTVGTEPTGAVYRGTAELRVGVERLFVTVPIFTMRLSICTRGRTIF